MNLEIPKLFHYINSRHNQPFMRRPMSKYELVVTEKKFKIGHSQSSFGFSCSFDHFQKGIEKAQMFFTNSF